MVFASPFRERYLAGSSTLHQMDARIKLPAAILVILAISFTPPGAWLTLLLLALPLPLLMVLGRLHPGVMVSRTLLALPFLLAVLPLAFTRPGDTRSQLPCLPYPVPGPSRRLRGHCDAGGRPAPPTSRGAHRSP